MSDKQVRAQYTLEYKLEAVRQVKAGQAVAVIAKILGIPKATLSNWVSQAARAEFSGAADKPSAVTPEQTELARLRAENARLRMERDIEKKLRRTSLRTRCEVRLDSPNEAQMAGEHRVRCPGCQCQRVFQLAARRGDSGRAGPAGHYSDEALFAHMRAIHAEVKREYG